MAQNNGGPILVAALIVGASLVGASLLLRGSIERTATEVAGLTDTIAGMAGPRNHARPTQATRPDPNRHYAVNTTGAPVLGDPNAKIAIVEFGDFQCPFCGRVETTLKQIEKSYGNKVKVVFMHLPLSIHPKAPAAHAAAEAAHRQGKFWEMHDKIFADQKDMSPEKYLEYAKEIGLNMDEFKHDLTSPAVQQRIEANKQEAAKLGISGTPAFFVNGRFLSGAQPYSAFKRLIDEELGKG